jgi:hypothetical protein
MRADRVIQAPTVCPVTAEAVIRQRYRRQQDTLAQFAGGETLVYPRSSIGDMDGMRTTDSIGARPMAFRGGDMQAMAA